MIMKTHDKIFLTYYQVLDAIRRDFNQYESQFALFQELCPILTDKQSIVTRKSRTDCVLITRGKKSKIRHMSDRELSRYLFAKLTAKNFPLPIMSEICARVFQTSAWPGQDTENSQDGIWIKTQMSDFKCRRCGNCCRNLKYHNDCTQNDYNRWKRLARQDILDKVMIIEPPGAGIPRYKIWKKSGSGELYEKCPWLVPSSSKGRYECSIQEIKPDYCRQYPLTRKHAVMTGCQGIFLNR